MEPQTDPNKQSQPDTSSDQTTVGGYDPNDILKAPLSAPEPVNIEPPEMTSNHKVKSLMTMAIVLFIVGLLLMPLVNIALGFIVLLVAACVAVTAVFAPIK